MSHTVFALFDRRNAFITADPFIVLGINKVEAFAVTELRGEGHIPESIFRTDAVFECVVKRIIRHNFDIIAVFGMIGVVQQDVIAVIQIQPAVRCPL